LATKCYPFRQDGSVSSTAEDSFRLVHPLPAIYILTPRHVFLLSTERRFRIIVALVLRYFFCALMHQLLMSRWI
jgi:hypothetical protein